MFFNQFHRFFKLAGVGGRGGGRRRAAAPGAGPAAAPCRARRLLWAAALLPAAALAQGLPAQAGGRAGAQVAVGATVLRHLALRVLAVPGPLHIAPADIASGYVDVPQAWTLEVHSNSAGGCLLAIESLADFSRGLEVRGLGGAATLGRAGGLLHLQAAGPGLRTTPVALRLRVLLSPQARAGVHSWPLQVSVLPL